jgi:hypothetical protein
MPDTDRGRGRRRLAWLTTASAVLAAAALGAPSPAAAYQQHFCQNVFLLSGTNCHATDRHSLLNVYGFSMNTVDRVCVATHNWPFGTQNSDWRCDYKTAQKNFTSRVDGVGTVRNGDPQAFVAYGIQEY